VRLKDLGGKLLGGIMEGGERCSATCDWGKTHRLLVDRRVYTESGDDDPRVKVSVATRIGKLSKHWSTIQLGV
jgi:hypothetical protein